MRIYWLWGLAERAEWNEWRPRWLWWRVLRWQDRAHGYYVGMAARTAEGVSQGPPG